MGELKQSLSNIQMNLKAPKGQRNSFGNYNYRSAEDILEALKPLLFSENVILTLSDEIVLIGNRFYVKATAKLESLKEDGSIVVNAYAREEETKKGMDASQITGTASSYARKYALNGLFDIDDNKDADTDEFTKQNKKVEDDLPFPEVEEKKESYYIQVMKILNDSKGKIKNEVVTNWTTQFAKGKKVNDLTPTEFTNLVNFLEHYE